MVSQCGIDHQKPTILLIFGTLSLGGFGGHPMKPKSNLKDIDQMSKQITSNQISFCQGQIKKNILPSDTT